MNLTSDIVRLELIGNYAKISNCSHPANIRISGRVVEETRNTFTIQHQRRNKIVAKDTSTFCFRFPDASVVEIDGKLLLGRPEDRLKKRIRRLW